MSRNRTAALISSAAGLANGPQPLTFQNGENSIHLSSIGGPECEVPSPGDASNCAVAHETIEGGEAQPPPPRPRDADSVGLGLDRGEPAYFMSPSVTRSSQLAVQHSGTLPCVTRGQGPKALAYSARLKGQLRDQCLSGTCPSVGHRTATVASLFCCLLKTVASVTGGQTVQEVPDWKLRDLCDSAR